MSRLPQDPLIEQSVIGAMLQERRAAEIAVATLKPDDFFDADHRLVFSACAEALNRGMAPDLPTVGMILNEWGKLLGKQALLLDLVEKVPTSAQVEVHAKSLRAIAAKRSLVATCQAIANLGMETSTEVAEFEAVAQGMLAEVQRVDMDVRTLEPADLLLEASAERRPLHVRSGVPLLDTPSPLLVDGRLVLLAGRPNAGKTALLANVLAHCTMRDPKIPVLCFSCEQSAREMVYRTLAIRMNRRLHDVVTDDLEVWDQEAIASSTLYLNPMSAPDIDRLQAIARGARARWGIRLVAIDHVGRLVSTGRRYDSRQEEVAYIARSLKGLAKDISVPVLVLVQMSRAVENRRDARPQLSDLRESGALEQEADAVLFIWSSRENAMKCNRPTTLTLEKNRHGMTAERQCVFNRPKLQFEWETVSDEPENTH